MGRTFFTLRRYLTVLCCQISADSTLHFRLCVTLLLFAHYLFYIAFINQNKPSDYTAFFLRLFFLFQLKVNILDFLFYWILKQFVALSLWGRYFFHVDPGY